MRLAGVFVLAFVASAIAGPLGLCRRRRCLPDWDDPAGRGLAEAFRGVLIARLCGAWALFSTALRSGASDRERHLKRALYVLLLVPFLIVVLGLIDNGIHDIHWLHESVGMVQMFTPLWTVALVQWLVLHMYLSRRTLVAEAAAT